MNIILMMIILNIYLFDRENDYDDIVNMEVEGRYERQKVILEDTEIARGINRKKRTSYKEYADKFKKLKIMSIDLSFSSV